MSDRVILLGAGASAEANIPTALELLPRIREHLKEDEPTWTHVGLAIDAVIGALKQRNALQGKPDDPVDIEAVFAALELLAERDASPLAPFVTAWAPALTAAQRPPLRSYVHHVRMMLERDIEDGLREGHPHRFDSLSGLSAFESALEDLMAAAVEGRAEPFRLATDLTTQWLSKLCWATSESQVAYLGPLIASAINRPLWLATLNFDNTVELAPSSVGAKVDIGIRSGRNIEFDPTSSIKLAKLHGSLNWALKDAWTIEVKDEPTPFSRMIFGAENKLRVDGPYLDLLMEFRRALKFADALEVCGYSFRDSHVNHTILSWLNSSRERKLIIIDPKTSFDAIFANLSVHTGFALPFRQRPTPSPDWLRKCIELRPTPTSEWAAEGIPTPAATKPPDIDDQQAIR